MSNLVIVAIPARDEKVWKVSSEKVPHMTLLFLGENPEDVPKLGRITQFVQHAAETSEHGPFMASVDERGTLGDDEADVLFFRKGYDLRWITEFRNQLLQQNDIRAAYETADQHPEWLPHLTLGYPETPAYDGEIPEHGLNWITFDRIAVWTGDFEGPEFKLTWPERELEGGPMAMSTMNDELKAQGPEALLEHFGVKGMRWGVRQAKDTQVTVGGKSKMVTAKKAAKLDAQWEKNQYTLPKAIERHNAMADHFNSRIGALNDQHKDLHISDEQWDNPSTRTPQQKEYMKKVDNLTREGYERAIAKELPSPTGRKKTTIEMRGDQMSVVIKDVHAKHAAVEDGDEVFLFRVTRNADGRITKIEPVEDSMSQAADRGAEFVEHHGVKGMKWGVRKDRKGRDRFNPEGHKTGDDIAKALVLPPGANAPAVTRLAKRAGPKIKRGALRVADVTWELTAYSESGQAAVHNEAAKRLNGSWAHKSSIHELNTSPKYKGKNLDADLDLKKEYQQDLAKVTEKAYNEAVKTTYGKSPTGRKEATWVNDASGARIVIRSVKHDTLEEDVDVEFKLRLDENGQVIQVNMAKADGDIAQTAILGEEFLEHFGIKGMKWGVRNRKGEPVAVTPTATSKVPAGTKRKTKIKVEGGENHPAHEDAIKVAQAHAKLKKSGPAALSNQELREVANRLQLENQVALLTSNKGKQFVARQLSNEGQNIARVGVREGVKKGARKVGVSALA